MLFAGTHRLSPWIKDLVKESLEKERLKVAKELKLVQVVQTFPSLQIADGHHYVDLVVGDATTNVTLQKGATLRLVPPLRLVTGDRRGRLRLYAPSLEVVYASGPPLGAVGNVHADVDVRRHLQYYSEDAGKWFRLQQALQEGAVDMCLTMARTGETVVINKTVPQLLDFFVKVQDLPPPTVASPAVEPRASGPETVAVAAGNMPPTPMETQELALIFDDEEKKEDMGIENMWDNEDDRPLPLETLAAATKQSEKFQTTPRTETQPLETQVSASSGRKRQRETTPKNHDENDDGSETQWTEPLTQPEQAQPADDDEPAPPPDEGSDKEDDWARLAQRFRRRPRRYDLPGDTLRQRFVDSVKKR